MSRAALTAGVLALLLTSVAERPAEAQAPRVSLQLQPDDVIGLDELAVLRLRVEGGTSGLNPDPDFQLDNFRIAGGPSQSTSLSIVNGVPSSSVTFSWHLKPLAVGKARVYGAKIRLGDETVQLPEQQLEVQELAPPGRRGQRPSDPLDVFSRNPFDRDPFDVFERQRQRRRQRQESAPQVFLRAEAVPERPYVGQQVLYTLYLYTQVDVRSVNPVEIPSFTGFWNSTIPQPEQLQPEMVVEDGERFGKVVLQQRALFPRRAGRLEVEPFQAELAALVPDSGPFGSLMPRTQDVRRESNAVIVDVQELPPPPDGFQGVVGQVNLAAELTPQELEVGEAATLTVTLTGRGHLQGAPPPALPELAGLKTFPPQQQSEEGLKGKSVTGSRTWSFVLVPERPGEWRLPAIEVPYFDPESGRYLTASSTELALRVRGTTSVAQEGGSKVELHPIRNAALPTVSGAGASGWTRARPWLFALPWGLAAGLLLLRRRGGGHGGAQSRRQLLQRLRAAEGEERPRQAAASIEEAWRAYLASRWQIPQGVPSTQWAGLLKTAGAQAEAADELVKLADDLHYLRYAPKLSSTDELRQELLERSRKLARSLR